MEAVDYKLLFSKKTSLTRIIKTSIIHNKYLRYLVNRRRYGRLVDFFLTTYISKGSTFEGANKVYYDTSFGGKIGFGSYIGPHCEICAEIGRFTSIAPWVRTNTGIHPIGEPYVTTSPMLFSSSCQNGYTFTKRMLFEEYAKPCKIGNDVWIQENVFFVGGISIGDGAVVMAGAVVTHDVPPYAIVGGVPAKIIKYRYDEETIDKLLKFQWWNKPIEWIKQHVEDFSDLNSFKQLMAE